MTFVYTAVVVFVSTAMSGCGTTDGPERLVIESSQYAAAFDAAVEAARADGMTPLLRDRRAGRIVTEASLSGSVLEPWRTRGASINDTWENTLAFQRRRARIEFAPVDAAATTDEDGPDLFGSDESPIDLTQYTGRLEVQVQVIVERAHAPGVRRSTWSRRYTTTATLTAPESEQGIERGLIWSPLARDPDYQRRLLSEVEWALR